MNLLTALARLLIFPGLLFAVPAAWFFLWVERKAVALMQGRVGPPFMQPFFDFIKLLGKSTPPRSGIGGLLMRAWPLIAVSAAAGAVGLLPVLPSSGGFEGDLILLLALLELPSMCIIAAGFSSRSIFGRNRVRARSRPERCLQRCLPARHRLHRRLAAHFPPRSPCSASCLAAALAWRDRDPRLPARQAAPQSVLAAQRRAGDLLRPHD